MRSNLLLSNEVLCVGEGRACGMERYLEVSVFLIFYCI
jgi:hypothetical protein